jgi:hypothetical protein
MKEIRLKTTFVKFLLLVMFSSPALSQEKMSYGINGGIGVWRMMALEESFRRINSLPSTYPIGYTLGLYVENPLSKQFSIVNELFYQNNITTVITDPGADNLYQRVVMKQVVMPMLMKYHTMWPSVSYFIFGPSLGFLIRANYVYDEDNGPKGSAEITKDLPAIQTALEFGLGKEIQISSADLNLELRGQWGFTTFRYKRIDYNDPPDIGRWKNAGLKFVIGYKLN